MMYLMLNGRVILLLFILFLSSPLCAQSNNQSLAVIVNQAVNEETISEEFLGEVLMGNVRFWKSGGHITLLIQAPVSWERDIVLGKVMGMSEPQFRQFWISKVFRTEVASGPKVVLSNEMAAILISKIPGAVAFVKRSEIPADAKVLKINGLLPGEDGYPLMF